MTSRYWIVSLPAEKSNLWSKLCESVSKIALDTSLYRFNVPDLRVGTLDSLLALSDELVKSNIFIEGVSHKLRRQIDELERVSSGGGPLTVDGGPVVETYITRFAWDEAKYPTMSPLKDLVNNIYGLVAKIEDDMKVRAAEYNTVRSQLNTIIRKQGGTLTVRDLSDLVKPEDIITTENLQTLLAIIPKYSQNDWISTYETLASYVVPRSSKKLYEDNEYALYTVILFKRVADNFKVAAHEKGFQTREFEYNPEVQDARKKELQKLIHHQESMRASLVRWCYSSYDEVCSVWKHFCAIRVFTESILRYGLSLNFLSVVLSPPIKSEKKVRDILEDFSGNAASIYWNDDDVAMTGEVESYPYVSFTINLI